MSESLSEGGIASTNDRPGPECRDVFGISVSATK